MEAPTERVSGGSHREARVWPFTPILRLFASRSISSFDDASPCGDVAAAALVRFDYGGTRVRPSDEGVRILRSGSGGLEAVTRDIAAEHAACVALERLGAVDVTCLDDVATDDDCDYVIQPFGGTSDRCAFTQAALAELAAAGWTIEIDRDYPYQLVGPDRVTWDASVSTDTELPDWFGLELGVVVDGRKIDLLPVVLDFVDGAGDDEDLKSAAKRLSGSVALRISETHSLSVPVERFRTLVRVVVELYQGVRSPGAKIRFPVQRAPAIARLADWMGSNGAEVPAIWRDPSQIRKRGRAISEMRTPVAPPLGLQATLRSYQLEGVNFLQGLREQGCGGILADDMGLGKTLQTIAHLATEKAAGRLGKPALVIAPTSLVFNWMRELEKFAPHLKTVALVGPRRRALLEKLGEHDVVVTSYPVVIRDVDKLEHAGFSTLILDEAQAIKNARSQTHKALERLPSEHRICLSGTPVENDLGELWALFHFVEPALLGDEPRFRDRFRVPIEGLGDESRLEALRDIIAPYVLRRNKRDVAPELPQKTELLRPVELADQQRELYEHIRVAAHGDVRKAIRAKGLAASTISILDAIMKLRQVCCDPRLVALDEARSVKESAKYQSLMALLEAELPQGRRVLIFSQFTSMLALIAAGLEERGIAYSTLTGQTRDRRAAVDEFESERVSVFLISLKAGGTGLNLVSADTVVHYDPWWNPASQTQATDRAYRIGQTKPVFVHHLYVAGSVEERVLMLQRRKAYLAGAILGESTQAPTGLTELDVERLLSPLDA